MYASEPEHGHAMLSLPQTPASKQLSGGVPATIPRLRPSVSSLDRLISKDCPIVDPQKPNLLVALPSLDVLPAAEEKPSERGAMVTLLDLPEEIQQRILDMMMGELQAPSTSASEANRVLRNWNSVMRHPQSRRLADLCLVSNSWRRLVQGRIYRHIKIQGTIDGIHETYDWFLQNPHLSAYVRHIEFWVPIWQRRGGARDIKDPSSTTLIDMTVDFGGRPSVHFGAPRNAIQPVEPISAAYCLSSQKSTLDELFECVADLFQSACILTIEGGHCKRPPMIALFRHSWIENFQLAALPRIQTLVLRGAWNVMREVEHFRVIGAALPNLKEWHCAYTKPKSGGYRTMHDIALRMPPTITRLNICLDGFYSSKSISTFKSQDIMQTHHLCAALGAILPRFEGITLSGRFCSTLFTEALKAVSHTREVRLKSMDLVIKNCCRPLDHWNDGTGYRNWGFICAFERLVVAATRILPVYPHLHLLRIRYVDLDAPCPLLNPYFHMTGNEATGVWNDEILANIAKARPNVTPVDLAESFGAGNPSSPKIAMEYPMRRPRSIKISGYAAFSEGALI